MQTVGTQKEYIDGVFVRELKNRFLCEVLIHGVPTVCYVPSSCHLSNFLHLKGKKVLLVPTQAPNARTQYALFAVKYKRSYILLNTSLANRAMENSIKSRRFSFLKKRNTVYKEHLVQGYKEDLYLVDTGTIVEVKSVISTEKCAVFPTVLSERTQHQLQQLQALLQQGVPVCFLIVSLCPYVDEIVLDTTTPFYEQFVKCMNLGMKAAAFSCRLTGDNILIDKKIDIRY